MIMKRIALSLVGGFLSGSFETSKQRRRNRQDRPRIDDIFSRHPPVIFGYSLSC
jgi:uncharacterized protein YneF (UPF0154 family)